MFGLLAGIGLGKAADGSSSSHSGKPQGGYFQGSVNGPGGQSYSPLTTGQGALPGFPSALQGANGYAGVASSLLQGSAEAEKMMRKAAAYDYAHRAGGLARGFSDYQGSLTGDINGQGLSPELAKRMLYSRRAATLGAIGEAGGQSQATLYSGLAELRKGTGTELADLKLAELEQMLQLYYGKKAADQQRRNSLFKLAGSAIGAAAGGMGGGAAGAAGGGYNYPGTMVGSPTGG